MKHGMGIGYMARGIELKENIAEYEHIYIYLYTGCSRFLVPSSRFQLLIVKKMGKLVKLSDRMMSGWIKEVASAHEWSNYD